jgi:hypothetical protein
MPYTLKAAKVGANHLIDLNIEGPFSYCIFNPYQLFLTESFLSTIIN